MSVVSPTADVPFCQSMRYKKDHMSEFIGRSHCISTMGGTGLASLGLRGGPGQAVVNIIYVMYKPSCCYVFPCCFL